MIAPTTGFGLPPVAGWRVTTGLIQLVVVASELRSTLPPAMGAFAMSDVPSHALISTWILVYDPSSRETESSSHHLSDGTSISAMVIAPATDPESVTVPASPLCLSDGSIVSIPIGLLIKSTVSFH